MLWFEDELNVKQDKHAASGKVRFAMVCDCGCWWCCMSLCGVKAESGKMLKWRFVKVYTYCSIMSCTWTRFHKYTTLTNQLTREHVNQSWQKQSLGQWSLDTSHPCPTLLSISLSSSPVFSFLAWEWHTMVCDTWVQVDEAKMKTGENKQVSTILNRWKTHEQRLKKTCENSFGES